MKSKELICRNRSSLLVVDVQEKLMPVIDEREEIVGNINRMLEAATLFQVPITVSQQYPKGLGPTVAELSISQYANPNNNEPENNDLASNGVEILDKTTFSCRELSEKFEKLKQSGRDQIVLTGIESHICVLQTALDLHQAGIKVFLVADAIGSRKKRNSELAITRCTQLGVIPVTTESVLFEWCETSTDANFKAVSKLVK